MVVALYFNYPCEKVLHYIYQFIFKDSIEMGSCFQSSASSRPTSIQGSRATPNSGKPNSNPKKQHQPNQPSAANHKSPKSANREQTQKQQPTSAQKGTDKSPKQQNGKKSQTAPSKANSFQPEFDLSPPYASFYEVDGNRLRYLSSQFNRLQITSKHPFPPEKVHSISVTIVKQQPDRAICVGFLIQSRKQKQSSGDVEDDGSMGFWSYTSGQYEVDVDGVQKLPQQGDKQDLGCAVGGVVELSLDMTKGEITIKRKQFGSKKQYAAIVDMPSSFRKNKVYAFVSMIQKDDEIKVEYSGSN